MKMVCVVASAAALLIASTAGAVTLNKSFVSEVFLDTMLPGTTAVARPELSGTVIAQKNTGFSYGALSISGTVESQVIVEDGTGTLDFYWRIVLDTTPTPGAIPSAIKALRLGNFGYGSIEDADFRTDLPGSVGPHIARVFNPVVAPEGSISFLFGEGFEKGSSYSFFLRTSATSYAETAVFNLLAGSSQTISPDFSTFAPAAVPEPSAYALMLAGLLGLGWMARRRGA